MSVDKSGSPQCGIYVRIDDFSNMLNIIGYVRQMAFAINRSSGYEKNLVVIEVGHSEQYADRARDIIPIIKDQGFVSIISGTHNIVNADGILLDKAEDLKNVRDTLGNDKIIGIEAQTNNIQEMLLLNTDFIVTPADPTSIAEVSRKTEALCVARSAQGLTNENCGFLVRAGAGLVDVSDYILKYEKGVLQATVNILDAIGTATKKASRLN